MLNKKFCLECNSALKGRADKKFCDDLCRSKYNYNLNYGGTTNLLRIINRSLKRNHNILKLLHRRGVTRICKQVLVSRGFDFSYYTSTHQVGKKNRCYFCYDLGYLIIDDPEVLLLKRDNHFIPHFNF